MKNLRRIVVAGASLAGLRAVQSLRREGFDGEVTLIGAETHVPYNRPPLSKSVLRGDDDVSLPGSEELDDQWLRGRQAVRLRPVDQAVDLDDGSTVAYDGVVIATGARPRRFGRDLRGVHTLRTIEDALALRTELEAGPDRVVVVGGGFIGGEVATTASQLGLKVTLVDAGPRPMLAALGSDAAAWLAAHHEGNGVELVSGSRVTGLDGNDKVTGVLLDDGRRIPADLVVAALGVRPNTDWLEGSGLIVDDGVVTDAALFAKDRDDIVAAGDVVRFPHQLFGGDLVRVEHWSNANDQGLAAARNLLAGPDAATPYRELPTFATHVHGARIQVAGLPHLADEAEVVAGSIEEDRFAVSFARRGVPVAVVAVNSPKDLIRLKRTLVEAAASAAV